MPRSARITAPKAPGVLRSLLGARRHWPEVINSQAECDPALTGLSRNRVETIWRYVRGFYSTDLSPAITLCLRRQGHIALLRGIGHADGLGPNAPSHAPLASPDTPICLFSSSKAITALLVHKLVEDGKVGLDEPVATYIPEFAAHGKGKVTVRALLAHRAGIPSIPFKDVKPELFYRWDDIIAGLCAAKPFDPEFEKQAYHAITGGYILGELVQRVSGLDLRVALQEWLAKPLGCQYLSYGLAPEHRSKVAPNKYTGPKVVWPLTTIVKRVLGAGFGEVVDISNSDAFMDNVIPAGNIFANADDACRVFQMLANGGVFEGRRIFSEDTVAEAIRPFGPIQFDGMLLLPMRFSAGFMLGEKPFGLYGPDCPYAYGHLGFLNIICWADPQRDIAGALLTTGKTVSPRSILHLAALTKAINTVCEDVPHFRPA